MSLILERKREIRSTFVSCTELVRPKLRKETGPTGMLFNTRANTHTFIPIPLHYVGKTVCIGCAMSWIRELKRNKNITANHSTPLKELFVCGTAA